MMPLLSTTTAISQYQVHGQFEGNPTEAVREALKKEAIPTIPSECEQLTAGWASYEKPYDPNFVTHPFIYGTYFLFSLRIDKKSIPAKLVQQRMAIEIEKRKKETGRDFLSKSEKSEIRDHVMDVLMSQTPAVPNTHDVLWDYEGGRLLFFSTQKAANELLETLFLKSFGLKLVPVFPYTSVMALGLTDAQKDQVFGLSPLNLGGDHA